MARSQLRSPPGQTWNALELRRKRKEALRKGLCINCRVRRFVKTSYCLRCLRLFRLYTRALKARQKAKGLCPDCPRRPESGRIYCRRCIDVRRRRLHGDYWRWRRKRRCPLCGRRASNVRTVCASCRRYTLKHTRLSRYRLRRQLIEKYGGACACCGIAGFAFLCLDHVFNDGNVERKYVSRSHTVLYRWLLHQKGINPRYQLLCWNCNMAKYHNGGVCPHVTARRARGPASLRGAPGRRPATVA